MPKENEKKSIEKSTVDDGLSRDKANESIPSDTDANEGQTKQLADTNGDFPGASGHANHGVWETRVPSESELQNTEIFQGDTSARLPNASAGQRFLKVRRYRQGGLGQVYIAIDTELSREIALKEIRSQHSHDAESRLRFIREAEITGRLEHPGIVPVYGFGTHDDGRPYYAMRFIRGESLEDAIRQFHVTTAEGGKSKRGRLLNNLVFRDLVTRLIDACQAIHYAHSRGILHRDIKPANIMLGQYGETIVVDWGLAKALGDSQVESSEEVGSILKPQSSGNSTPTMIGSAFGTPGYMSPEQAIGQIDKLSPVSDVFSIGATLYHLLTGNRPLHHLKTIAEVQQAVCQGRIASPRALNSNVDAAIDAICNKAMHVDPNARYGTAAQMAIDLEKYLADEPVDALVEPLSSRTSRWIRRNTSLVVLGIVTLFFGLAAAASVAWINGVFVRQLNTKTKEIQLANTRASEETIAAREAEKLAKAREKEANTLASEKDKLASDKAALAEEASEIANFLLDLFQASDPVRQGNKEFRGKPMSLQMTAKDLLDRGAQRLNEGGALRDYGSSRAKLMGAIGDVYRQLSLFDEAEPLLVESVKIYEASREAPPEALADSYHKLAQLQHEQGDYIRGLENYKKALALRETLNGDAGVAQVANTFHNMGWLLANMGENQQAQSYLEKAAKIRSELPDYGPNHRETLFSQIGIAFCLIEQEKWAEALPIVIGAATKLKSVNDNKNMTNALLSFAKGVIYRQTLSAKAAEKELRETVDLVAAELGSNGIYYGLAQFELALALLDQKREDEALELMRNCMEISRSAVHMKHPRIRILLNTYARLLVKRGSTDEASQLWKEFLTAQDSRFSDRDRFTYENLITYAFFQRSIGDDVGALESLLRIEQGIVSLDFDSKNQIHGLAMIEHADILNEQNSNPELAIELCTKALEILQSDKKLSNKLVSDVFFAHTVLAIAHERNGGIEQATEQFNDAEKIIGKLRPKDTVGAKNRIEQGRCRLFLAQGEIEKAIACCERRIPFAKADSDLLMGVAIDFAKCGQQAFTKSNSDSQRDSCFSKAVELLEAAMDQGLVTVDELKSSSEFQILKDYPGFQKLLVR